MTFTSPRFRLLLAIVGTFVLATTPWVIAIDAGDMDPHLPDEAILSAMRFRAFTRKANDKVAWESKHAELLKNLDQQLEKASLTDTRAATALRTLIADLKDAKYVALKKPAGKQRNEYPALPNGHRVMVNEEFHINKPELRVITYPFEIKEIPAMLKVAIGGGSDDSGDGGLHYMLIDPVGRVIKRGFSNIDDFVWVEHLCTRQGKWKLVIEDLDTDLNAKRSPGNRGAVEVLSKTE